MDGEAKEAYVQRPSYPRVPSQALGEVLAICSHDYMLWQNLQKEDLFCLVF